MPKPARSAEARYTAAQRAAAEAVLEDPERYGGEEAALVRWARLAMRESLKNSVLRNEQLRLDEENHS